MPRRTGPTEGAGGVFVERRLTLGRDVPGARMHAQRRTRRTRAGPIHLRFTGNCDATTPGMMPPAGGRLMGAASAQGRERPAVRPLPSTSALGRPSSVRSDVQPAERRRSARCGVRRPARTCRGGEASAAIPRRRASDSQTPPPFHVKQAGVARRLAIRETAGRIYSGEEPGRPGFMASMIRSRSSMEPNSTTIFPLWRPRSTLTFVS